MLNETLIPRIGVVTDIRQDTPDVKTFRVVGTDGKKLFEHIPGQCAPPPPTKNIWNFPSRSAAALHHGST